MVSSMRPGFKSRALYQFLNSKFGNNDPGDGDLALGGTEGHGVTEGSYGRPASWPTRPPMRRGLGAAPTPRAAFVRIGATMGDSMSPG